MVQKVPFEDFAKNSFEVTINRVQALALSKASHPVPLPTEQLAILKKKQEKKRKESAALIGEILVHFF